MRFFGFTVILLLCALVALPERGNAQRQIKDCAHARSTSDTMTCVKKRVEASQSHLNDLYKKTLDLQPAEINVPLGEAQKNWITYRDAQCAWEAGQAEQGQEKIYELSCLAVLTEQRIAIIESINEISVSDKPREYSSHPRWMNALAEDYPDVLWKYSQWLQADIDCDGTNEEVMTGISMKLDPNGKPFTSPQESDLESVLFKGPFYKAEAIIALSENVKTGRSKTTLFRVPVGQNDQTMYFCDVPQGITFVEEEMEQQDMPDETESGKKSCPLRLRVADGNCSSAVILWDGAKYQLQKERPDILEKKSDKE